MKQLILIVKARKVYLKIKENKELYTKIQTLILKNNKNLTFFIIMINKEAKKKKSILIP